MPSAVPAEGWEESFDRLSENIIMDFHPGSVLDVGCGNGALIKCLRERGIDAWGVDTSNEIIQHALSQVQSYCQVGSLSEPFPQPRYDLIICIDVIEHLPPESAESVIGNLCRHSDDILISCLSLDIDTHEGLNTKPPGYWTDLFMHFGFVHNIYFEDELINPWAMHFKKSGMPVNELIQNYEAKLQQLTQENDLRRLQAVDHILELSRNEHQHQAQIQRLRSTNAQTQADLDAVLNSTSWQFMMRVQNVRKRIIPIGSKREAVMRSVFRLLAKLQKEGPVGFFVIAFKILGDEIEWRITRLLRILKLRVSRSMGEGQTYEIDGVIGRKQLEPHKIAVDIIICVHNALDDVQRCLDSLLEHTTPPYNLILVDDGSEETTARVLREFANTKGAMLLRSDKATGYPYAANRGMRASTAELVVLLNSDTILTPEWLDRLVACMQSDPQIGMVGPLSNTASWQSVPKIEDDGDWAINPLPSGVSPACFSQLITLQSARLWMEMPLLNGFCLMIRYKLLDEVGLFDEENFGRGYGEEDDLVLRSRNKGWKMALADDVYIYHTQSKSYSSGKRHALSEQAGKILRRKHGDKIVTQGVQFCQHNPALEGIRARAHVILDRDQCLQQGRQFSGKRLLFIVPVNTPGGGTNVIRSEANAMHKMGVKSVLFNLAINRQGFEAAYPDLLPSTIFGKIDDLTSVAQNFDAAIATFNTTVAWLEPLQSIQHRPVLAYYIQGFEPWIYPQGSQGHKTALNSYTLIEDMTLFTKTDWTRQKVNEMTGRKCTIIGASVDIDLYCPRPRKASVWPDGPLRIAAMIRPESPYREPLKTMQLLRQAQRKYRGEVEILLFGTTQDNPAFQRLPHDFSWKLYGLLRPEQVANLLSQTDIFVDYSSHQAMGLTAMEAMACGCAVIVPQHGGVQSYAVHEKNALITDTSSLDNVWHTLQRLVDDEKLRLSLQRNAIYDICAYYPERAALNILHTLFGK